MAYSDYGGYAYKNGIQVDERSDVVLCPDEIKSTPGAWPGWTIDEGRSGGSWHVVLGSGPIFVCLLKQSYASIYRGMTPLEQGVEGTEDEDSESKTAVREIEGVKIDIRFVYTDNYYTFVRMEEPDGTVWTGFSGYGVGAGLEDGDHGFSTAECERYLRALFPPKS